MLESIRMLVRDLRSTMADAAEALREVRKQQVRMSERLDTLEKAQALQRRRLAVAVHNDLALESSIVGLARQVGLKPAEPEQAERTN